MPSARRNQRQNRRGKAGGNKKSAASAKARGGGGSRNEKKKNNNNNTRSSMDHVSDDDSDGDSDEREDEDKYEDLPSDFSDEEIDEDEAFDEEDREMYRGMRFYDEKKKKKKNNKKEEEEEEDDEEDDDDGFGELIARAQRGETSDASDGNDEDGAEDGEEEELGMLEDSDEEEDEKKRNTKEKKKKEKEEKKTKETAGELPTPARRKIRGVNDALDEEEQLDLDSDDDDETRELDDDEKDDKRKKMLDDILGENRRERRLERPKPGSVTEYEKEGEYNAPVDVHGETLTLEDAIAALTRAKRSTGEIVDDDEGDDDDDTKPRKDGQLSGASLRALQRISGKEATKQPARRSVTEKMTRAAAYDMNKEDLGKWQTVVQENRKKETLTFESSSKKMVNRKDTLGALKDDFEPRTKMEKEIAAILKEEADALDEKQIAKTEELALSKMDPEEAKARRARLAKMKALMFYHEQKAARLKKIKSKDYHRREKRAKKMRAKKNGELMGNGDDDDLGLTMDDDDFDENGLDSEGRTAEERREYFRVRERVLLKHRNTSRWAKRAIKKGIAHLPGTREAMAEQHRLAQQLKQKVNAPGDDSSDEDGVNSDSESESESGSEDEDPEQRRKRAKQKALDALYQANGGDEDMPEGLSKGVFALPFMKRAQEKKKMETAEAAKAILEEMQREDDGSDDGGSDDDDDGLNIVDEKDAKEWKAIAEQAGAVTAKKKSRTEKQSEQQQKEAEKKKAASPLPAKTVPISKAARAIRERAALRNRPAARFEKFEPVLMEDDEAEKKRKAAAMKKAELYVEPRLIAEKEEKEKQKKKAIANGTYVEEEEDGEKDGRNNFPTATDDLGDQKSLVSRAFAGDDVEEAFQKEKLKDIEEELPDVERPTLLPGWGAWEGERKSTPKWIIDQNKKADAIREKALKSRKDAKLKRVIISERYDKKAAAYNVEQLPRGFDSKAVYEGSMRTPLGADVNTEKQFRKLTKPKILKPSGAVIAPIKLPKNARPPTADDESSKKKRRTKL